ncbi:DUF4906 domain-containing protein [Bacteroidaceae bacterium HV4-6-C5C]|nr:DUF4906 domain-containing protein [Bacteroidaceae bacterium HV4-6-C5C]
MHRSLNTYKVSESVFPRSCSSNNFLGLRNGYFRLSCQVNRLLSAYLTVFFIIPAAFFTATLFTSCTDEASVTEFSQGKDAVIRFQINADTPKDATTRSVDEDKISDLHILVYNSAGELTGKSYTTFSGTTYTVSVLARSGTGCKIYAIANTGSPALFDGAVAGTEDKLKAMTTNLATWATFNATSGTVYLPMSGSVTTDISAGTSSLQGGITVKRLMARITLNVGVAAGSGITISGYRVYGIPGRSYYVPHPLATEEQTIDAQTTRAVDASLPANSGDWINSGLVSLANVTSFSGNFYMYENRAGVNAGITAQNQKIKANVPATPADSAAYVMIYGRSSTYTSLSWKIYLGANNTGNFNIKRNNQYTYTITLKPTESDTRIIFKKLVWAGSNIYWNGSKLTFDPSPVNPANPTTQELANMKKQGVAFRWGSLVGISLSTTYVTYTPTYNSAVPANSTWSTGSNAYTNIAYITDNVLNGGQNNTFLNDVAQNTDANYAAYKGDICQYLSKTGTVSGSWRMPTSKEFNPGGVIDNASVAWTTSSTPWAKFGSFAVESSNAQGTTQLSSGGKYMINGNSSSFPAPGYRNYTDGTLYVVGSYGYYWSCSGNGSTSAYYFYFYDNDLLPAMASSRQYGFAIRCVQN